MCSSDPYGSVYWLRKHALAGSQLLVRRQPAWLDGIFECPWGEQHTYWPDGSFSFDRSREAKGWISRLRCRGDEGTRRRWLEDRMVYVDVEQEQKGVQYMQPEDYEPPGPNSQEGAAPVSQQPGREVRVVQWFGSDEHEEPLFPAPGLWDHIPLGRSVLAQTHDGGQVLLSRIRVRPLQGVATGAAPVSPPRALQRLLWLRLATLDRAVAHDLGRSRSQKQEDKSDASEARAGDALEQHGRAVGRLGFEAPPGDSDRDSDGPGMLSSRGDEDEELTLSTSSPESSEAGAEEVLSLLVSERWYEEVD